MASSFVSQIPVVVNLVSKLKPRKIIDIGKGFGKYGFLIHEYAGIDNQKRINPKLSLKEQSNITIDAVEIDETLLLPHLNQIYNQVFFGDIFDVYTKLTDYDLVIMIDIIEHLDKNKAIEMLKFFIENNMRIIISTPRHFFEQHLYESEFENHISFWNIKDFKALANVEYQKFDSGIIYLLTKEKIKVRGFGNDFVTKLRRISKFFKTELL